MTVTILVSYRFDCDRGGCRATYTVPAESLKEAMRAARRTYWTFSTSRTPPWGRTTHCPAHAYAYPRRRSTLTNRALQ